MKKIRLSKYGFHFSQKSKWGIFSLLVIIGLLLIFRHFLPSLGTTNYSNEDQKLAIAWKALNNQSTNKQRVTEVKYINDTVKKEKAELFFFDPNAASKEELVRLGLPMKTVYTWLHYLGKGGLFYKKEDIKKLYTLSDKDYQRVSPYLIFSNEMKKSIPRILPTNLHQYKSTRIIQLNIADSQALKSLPGIGSVLAGRIISFRNALGGFFEVAQLKEVYHLPDSTYQKIAGSITVNPSLIKKINLNSATYKDLHRQPYLRPFANQILKLRKKIGRFTELSQLRQISLINGQNYRKIAPYLTI